MSSKNKKKKSDPVTGRPWRSDQVMNRAVRLVSLVVSTPLGEDVVLSVLASKALACMGMNDHSNLLDLAVVQLEWGLGARLNCLAVSGRASEIFGYAEDPSIREIADQEAAEAQGKEAYFSLPDCAKGTPWAYAPSAELLEAVMARNELDSAVKHMKANDKRMAKAQ